MSIVVISALSGLIHFAGYFSYITNSQIEPKPITWLMFAYGTILLTVLEWESDATAEELFLPLVCSCMALFVAARCWRRARHRDPSRFWPREWWPSDWRDRGAFQIDIALTVLYLAAAGLVHGDLIDESLKETAVLVFLVAANLTTFSAFFPLIRNVVNNPGDERAGPWALWTCAYVLLGVTTFTAHGEVWTELMIYPTINAVLHGSVAVLSRRSRRNDHPAMAFT